MSFWVKVILGLVLLGGLAAGEWYFGHCEYVAGQNATQIKWDQSKQTAETADVKAVEKGAKTAQAQTTALDSIESNYIKANSNAFPSLAQGLPAAYSAGTVQLRDPSPAPVCSGTVSAATASSRAADAAATQALADRVKDSIAAIQAGDDADKREQQLDNQVSALQAALQADRANGN